MSYPGKLSRGCGECRARKVKCDLQKPECARCLKAGRQCPGYRDQLALRFRDETQSVTRRAKAGSHAAPSVSRRTPKSLVEESLVNTLTRETAAQREELFLLPMKSLVVDVQDQASCYFFQVYDWVGTSALIKGSFDQTTAPLGERALMAAISAVGKASIANIQNSNPLRRSARLDYGNTLQLTNAAIGDAGQYKKDSTLIAILLLSIFEVVTGQTPKAIEDWLQHVTGATELLKIRGSDSMSNTSPIIAFSAWRNQILTGCIYRNVPVPPTILKVSERLAATTCSPITTASHQLAMTMANFASLRHKIATEILNEPEEILTELYSIDTELSNWLNGVSPSCCYEIVISSNAFNVNRDYNLHPYEELCHKYPALPAATMWNNYRFTRILVGEMILNHLRPLAAAHGNRPDRADGARRQCFKVRDQMRQLADDICYSVPDILGLFDEEKPKSQLPAVKSSAGGFLLLWPLSMAAIVDKHPCPRSKWIFECFHIIAHAMGINQGMVLSRFLSTVTGMCDWVDDLGFM